MSPQWLVGELLLSAALAAQKARQQAERAVPAPQAEPRTAQAQRASTRRLAPPSPWAAAARR
jgi:hypothetical protein